MKESKHNIFFLNGFGSEKKISRSYIMIDNVGNMLDDFGEDYEIVGNIFEENFSDMFRRFQLDKELYQSRYI